jgi:hypothetical protein
VIGGGARELARWIGTPPHRTHGRLPSCRSTQAYVERLLRESLLMPADLGDEEAKLICSQLGTAFRESKKRQTVGMDCSSLSDFFLVGTSHELAVVAIFLHAASEQHVIINIIHEATA